MGMDRIYVLKGVVGNAELHERAIYHFLPQAKPMTLIWFRSERPSKAKPAPRAKRSLAPPERPGSHGPLIITKLKRRPEGRLHWCRQRVLIRDVPQILRGGIGYFCFYPAAAHGALSVIHIIIQSLGKPLVLPVRLEKV